MLQSHSDALGVCELNINVDAFFVFYTILFTSPRSELISKYLKKSKPQQLAHKVCLPFIINRNSLF